MKPAFFEIIASSLIPLSLASWVSAASIPPPGSSAAVLQAQKEAEGKGYIFLTSHDQIVSRAKNEGKLRVTCSLPAELLKHLSDAFKKKYPFIDARAEEVRGTEVYLRMLQEMKAGLLKGQDITDMAADFHNEYPPYQKKFDILGMAEQKVLQIPAPMVDPANRNIVAVASGTQGVAYNKTIVSADKVPDTWEDFLKPELSDRKFMVDTRPRAVIALIPAWGLERTLDFARKLAAQKPVWVNGQSRAITSLLARESALFFGGNFDSVQRAKGKDLTNSLGYKLIEPVPVRLDEPWSVLNTAEHPYAALLWLEFVVSPEGQKILDEYGPYEASVLIRGTAQEQAARGKRVSLLDWQHYSQTQEYQEKIIKAFGFPRADR